MYFIFGVKVSNENSSRIVPITSEMFSPDNIVLEQQLIRTIYPDSSYDFLLSLMQSNSVSEIKMFPSLYVNNSEVPTELNPLIDFLDYSDVVTGVKYRPSSQLFGDVIKQEIDEIMLSGVQDVIKKKTQLSSKVTKRSVNINSGDSTKVIAAEVTLKLFMNDQMYVSLFGDDPDDLLIDIIMQKSIFFKTTDISKLKIGYKMKIVELDLSNNSVRPLMSFKPVVLPIELKRAVIRTLQIPMNIFLGNVFDSGIAKVSDKYLKRILVNNKSTKPKK